MVVYFFFFLNLLSLTISLYTFSPTTSKKKQTLTSQKTKKIMAKKEIKKQTIEEILAEHTPTLSRAQSSVTTKRRRRSRNRSSSIPSAPLTASSRTSWTTFAGSVQKRNELSSVSSTAKEAYLADPDQEVLAQGLRKAGISLSRYAE